MGPMFRHDRPQAGRYRQFHQFDVEVIGDEGPAYDAEVIELTWSWLRNLGLRGLGLEVNSIGDPACRPAYLERLRAYYRPLRDQLHLDCQRRVEENPLRLLDCKEPQCQPFREAAPKITDHLCGPCAEHFERVRGLLRAAEIPFRLNPYLVRGLDYYTRTVFEYQHQALGGAQNALGGGGRYDGLAEALGFPAAAGVGFAGGLDRIVLMLDEQRRQERDEQGERGEGAEPPPEGPDLLLLPDGADLDSATAEVARRARATVSVAADFSRRSLRAKMRAAGRSGCPWVAIMSPDEAGRRVVQLRDMTTGEQREVGWDALADALARDVATTGDGR
jgi:histidyl-tRNA synthetase